MNHSAWQLADTQTKQKILDSEVKRNKTRIKFVLILGSIFFIIISGFILFLQSSDEEAVIDNILGYSHNNPPTYFVASDTLNNMISGRKYQYKSGQTEEEYKEQQQQEIKEAKKEAHSQTVLHYWWYYLVAFLVILFIGICYLLYYRSIIKEYISSDLYIRSARCVQKRPAMKSQA